MKNPNNVALMGVLEQVQHHHLTQALEGLLPPVVNAHKLKQVLDLQCNVGNWAIDLVLAYPGITVTALESNTDAIELARQSAAAGNIKPVHFYEADITKPLKLADNTFDFVHLLLSRPSLRVHDWGPLLQECKRVMKPRAVINLVALTHGPGSSSGYQRLTMLADQFLRIMGYSFTEESKVFSPGVYFCRLLREAEFSDSSYLIRPMNLGGWNNASGRACYQLFINNIQKARDGFVENRLISSEEFDVLVAQQQKEISEVDFCASSIVISAFATKR